MNIENTERDAKIIKWKKASENLKAAKQLEAVCRADVLKEVFRFEGDDREGTQNVELGNDYKLKSVFKLNRRLDNKDEAVDKVLSLIEKSGEEGQFVSDRLVKWKPELVLSEYKNLPENFKAMIDEILIASPGTPSLELIVPKIADLN